MTEASGENDVEAEDPLTRCLNSLHRCWFELGSQVEALRAENRMLKAQVSELQPSRECSKDFDNSRRPDSKSMSEEQAPMLPGTFPDDAKSGLFSEVEDSSGILTLDTLAPSPKPKRKVQARNKEGLRARTFGLKESVNVSLSAARLGMLTQREILMEELESQASMRRMMSAFVPAGDFEWRKPNFLQSISRHIIFKLLVMIAILANSAYLGFDADLQVRNSFRSIQDQDAVPHLPAADIVFPVIFVVELVIRLGAERRGFFEGEEKWWNVFDIVLVLNSGLETFTTLANFSFLRILRVFRLVRLVRVVRNVKSLKSLRTMIFALINSFTSLLWALIVICLIIFIFSILFCNGVAAHNNTIFRNLQNVSAWEENEMVQEALLGEKHFGGLWSTCVSLFSAVTGGNDWMMYGELLRNLKNGEHDITGELYFLIFGFYVAFCMIGLLNVVTGIFVDSAVSTRTEDEVVDAFTDQMAARCREVRRIFNEADIEGKGALTYEQLKDQLSNPWVKAYFHGLDIDPNEAAIIFTLMDTDHNGTVTADEFIDGTMKLKGSAKSVDMLLLMFDQVRFTTKFNFLCSFIEDELRNIKSVLTPGGERKLPAKIFKAPEGSACFTASKSNMEFMELLDPEEDAKR
ncbi:scn4aa [Symbiodinium necroappetens]|uniref:Scn4aa protein n=1 Tax=Symbiodinium necroappetens TaxID=1628268 RepID=A0A812VLY9_9DINO|nr:scn4aa [Symbiodinium necroappetens]